mmetsp:Transcript_22461/g.62024  ORF Transcript_22461/g.62024 Transcript_22461/m.62024 type:complete len:328 (+) Transcript_22461:177-1160(+)
MWHLAVFLGLCYVAFKYMKGLDANLGLLIKQSVPENGWNGKVVWICGASQGMGKQLAAHFAKHGGKLILSSRNEAKLQEVKSELPCPKENVSVLPVDLCGPFEQLTQAATTAEQVFGGLDVIVHCVGASMNALAAEVTPEVTDALLAVNTVGPIKLTRALLPGLLGQKRPARIVVVASMAAKVPSPGQSIYSACKMALYGYFSSLATELADTNVGVTIVCPGPVGSSHGPGSARAVYGPTGLISTQAAEKEDKARMAPARCVELISSAAYHGVDEAWISKHPVLALAYIFQLAPTLGWMILKRVGPKRAKAMKEGRSGYDVRGMGRQ